MAVNPNEDTEFNDALRKYGIIPQRETTPPTPSPPGSPSLEELLDEFDSKDLQEIGEDAHDDELERTIDTFNRQRLAEQKREEKRSRFGRLYPIGRDDYTREVTDASEVDEDGDDEKKGTGVICFLYKDGIPHSDRAFQHVQKLAAKYPRTKFVCIVGDKCIPNLPDSRIPMFIIYRKGEIRNQLVSWGADRERIIEELEASFLLCGVIDPPEHRRPGQSRDRDEDSSDDDDGDPSSRMRSAQTATNGRAAKNVRSQARKGEDSDSDFEFDL
ncbi:hypothetical protein SERLA73DRAFT_185924 [Serpula lacrymans var. lacrymans S7.3]|uniref:Phosducin domain-containing protein n=2 Tax=Serpula lacrymans var. lacrymans TaxID=341189 RepID=F8Q6N1_SERL3|nr:uncharacterized protein SERLADRAFT_474705 [Serpula lacrymans var. lacrymans S7.9]EGN96269.1 hypothetical protein SERLA73DRAFT_185924 [Serpula lacrymans var. lacrymans S7.3]EGO21808.1 hypothetical protein SERLADRAFT_474705 [Serpula lacrymans var. lacrymans S7.9]